MQRNIGLLEKHGIRSKFPEVSGFSEHAHRLLWEAPGDCLNRGTIRDRVTGTGPNHFKYENHEVGQGPSR
jgi:hypothetical protein